MFTKIILWGLMRSKKKIWVFKRRDSDSFLHAKPSNSCNNLLLKMTILTEFRYLCFSLKQKDILPKKVSSDLSYSLTYLTLKWEGNRIFHPCRDMFNFCRQALLNRSIPPTSPGSDFDMYCHGASELEHNRFTQFNWRKILRVQATSCFLVDKLCRYCCFASWLEIAKYWELLFNFNLTSLI